MTNCILLTGGAGFIGSHIAKAYLSLGFKVIIIDDLSSGQKKNIEHIIDDNNLYFYKIDINNKNALKCIFKEHKPQIINHHAAQKSVPFSVENPLNDLQTNLNGLLTLLEVVKEYPIEHFIYISSGGALSKEIIGEEKSLESDMPSQESPYAINKYTGEKYIELYSKLLDYKYTILRYSNVYVPRQIADGECGVIPIFVNNILNNRESVLMTYDDMPNGCTRDYVYIDDVVNANVLALSHRINDVVNISSGKEESILSIYNTICDVFNKQVPINIKGPRLGDVKRSVLSNEKAKALLLWEYKVDLCEGLHKLKRYIEGNSYEE